MRARMLVAAFGLCACASTGPSTGASTGPNGIGAVGGGDAQANVRRVSIGDVTVQANGDSPPTTEWQDVNAGTSSTWQALPIAYKRLGLTITRYDSVAHIIEGERLHSHASLGGKELTALMDCGEVEGMPNAARFDVNIQTRTVLRGNATRSSVASLVIASAKPDGVAGVYSPCAINATAPQRVNAAVVAAASVSSP